MNKNIIIPEGETINVLYEIVVPVDTGKVIKEGQQVLLTLDYIGKDLDVEIYKKEKLDSGDCLITFKGLI